MDVRKPLLQCIMIRTELTGMQLSSFQPNLISSISSILPSFRHSLIQSFLLSFLPSCISSSIHANVHLYSRVPIHSFSDSFFYDLRSFYVFVRDGFFSDSHSLLSVVQFWTNHFFNKSSEVTCQIHAIFPTFIHPSFLPSFLNYPKFLHFLIFHLFPESGVIHSIIFFRQCFHVRAPPAHHASRFL